MPETQTFVICSNNNTRVVMTLEVYERKMAAERDERANIGPVFLFQPDGWIGTPDRTPWITGSYSLMSELLRGHRLQEVDAYVPFSNGLALYFDIGDLVTELRQIGSVADAIEVFGLARSRETVTV